MTIYAETMQPGEKLRKLVSAAARDGRLPGGSGGLSDVVMMAASALTAQVRHNEWEGVGREVYRASCAAHMLTLHPGPVLI